MKGIVLVSGGLDSTLVLLKLLKDGHEVVPMFVDYNQWPLEGELDAFTKVCDWWATDLGYGSSGLLLPDVTDEVVWSGEEKVGSVWGRSIALVGLAAMWAYTHGNDYEFIALGNHKGDVGPDCKPGQFDASLHDSLIEGTKGQLDLVLPIRELTIEDIGRELAKFGIPWNLMFSCYWFPHCQYKSIHDGYMCPGCRRKLIAMRAGGATPEQLALPPNAPGNGIGTFTYQSELAEKVDY